MSRKGMQKDNRRAPADYFIGQFCITGRDSFHKKLSAFSSPLSATEGGSGLAGPQNLELPGFSQ